MIQTTKKKKEDLKLQLTAISFVFPQPSAKPIL